MKIQREEDDKVEKDGDPFAGLHIYYLMNIGAYGKHPPMHVHDFKRKGSAVFTHTLPINYFGTKIK